MPKTDTSSRRHRVLFTSDVITCTRCWRELKRCDDDGTYRDVYDDDLPTCPND